MVEESAVGAEGQDEAEKLGQVKQVVAATSIKYSAACGIRQDVAWQLEVG
jgi:hypothetical protein